MEIYFQSRKALPLRSASILWKIEPVIDA